MQARKAAPFLASRGRRGGRELRDLLPASATMLMCLSIQQTLCERPRVQPEHGCSPRPRWQGRRSRPQSNPRASAEAKPPGNTATYRGHPERRPSQSHVGLWRGQRVSRWDVKRQGCQLLATPSLPRVPRSARQEPWCKAHPPGRAQRRVRGSCCAPVCWTRAVCRHCWVLGMCQ